MGTEAELKTTTLLLSQLKEDGNEAAWKAIDGRFRGVIVAAARKLGVNEADAADVAQETLIQALRDYRGGGYDRARGRLSAWIIGIAHHRIADVLRGGRQAARDDHGAMVGQALAVEAVSAAWGEALREELCRRAWENLPLESGINPRNIRAFELSVLRGVPTEAVAAECGISAEQVYLAKNRVSGKLRELVERMTLAYEDGL